MSDPEPGLLDLSGLACPQVVLRLADHMRTLPPGSCLTVVCTDPLSAIDVPFFLHRAGHELLAQAREQGSYRFVIRRGPGAISR